MSDEHYPMSESRKHELIDEILSGCSYSDLYEYAAGLLLEKLRDATVEVVEDIKKNYGID